MTVKIRKLREQPLLNPPLEDAEGWREITVEDKNLMISTLNECREKSQGKNTLKMLYYMKALGVPFQIKDQDKRAIQNRLSHERGKNDGEQISDILFHMKSIGLEEPVLPQDEQAMREWVKINRERTIHGVAGNVAYMLYYMKGLGISEEVRSKDASGLKDMLDEARESEKGYVYVGYEPQQSGWVIAGMHNLLKGIGFPQPVTKKDQDEMKIALKQAREARDAWTIASMLSIMKDVMPPQDKEQESQTTPPLKKYVK